MAYEYYLEFWGAGEEKAKEELSLTENKFWFATQEERKEFLKKLQPFRNILVVKKEEGEDVRLQTIAKLEVTYKGKEYKFEQNFGYAYKKEIAQFMFEKGNYSCDCNLSIFINEEYPEFEELDCGNEIKIKSLEIIQVLNKDVS